MFLYLNNRNILRVALIVAGFGCIVGCSNSRPTSPEAKLAFESVIPKPVSATATGKTFVISKNTTIVTDSSGNEINTIGQYLADNLKQITTSEFPVSVGNPKEGAIYLTLKGGDSAWGDEGYGLTITESLLKVTANKPAGLFFALQTVRQLVADKNAEAKKDEWEIATGTITDYPEYAWRGSMLDVARHFFSVEDVKKYIDLISYYKMNIMHLHLSDDQGWRIEIKSWPNLTAIGGLSQVGGGKGGFYTQAQYSEIVAYAQSRYITIVPEIDLPGHINAALASYPELNAGPPIKREAGEKVRPIAGQPYSGVEVGFSTLHFKKDLTFKFVNDVIRELSEITPGPYIHIGGDEAAVTKKPDYIAFIGKFKEIVNANGKKMIGWEEIVQAALDSTAIAQHWHSQEYARMAADKGAKLIFSPATKVYLDMQYDSTSKLGQHWAAYIEVDSSYIWNPATHVNGIERDQILGVETPLWTETIVTMDDIEYMIFPRMPGIAEIAWSSADNRSWNEYKIRLANQAKRWKAMSIDFYHSAQVPWVE